MPSTTSANEHEAVPYKVEIAPAARRSLDRIHGPDLDRLRTAVETSVENPRPRGCRKLVARKDFYRIRVGDHPVIYSINAQRNTAVITKVARRTTTTYT